MQPVTLTWWAWLTIGLILMLGEQMIIAQDVAGQEQLEDLPPAVRELIIPACPAVKYHAHRRYRVAFDIKIVPGRQAMCPALDQRRERASFLRA